MPPRPLPSPNWVATPNALAKLVTELAKYSQLAVDTESNSLHAFRERLCLIQFSTPRADHLVDPLAIEDLSPLAPIFENPKIEKTFHAAEYDLICLKRDLGIKVVNLFDTMQAARILGYKQVGLDAVLAKNLNVQLDKKYQKADWGKRPLSAEMLSYARLDTHYLLDLRDNLQGELVKNGRWELAREEFLRLADGNSNGKTVAPAWQRVKGAQKCNERQLAILNELCAWRETQARSMNRPLFRVIDDLRLVAVAKAAPKNRDELLEAGLTSRQLDLYGNNLLRAVERGRKTLPLSRPHTPRPSQAYMDRLNRLIEWRKAAAIKLGIDSDLVLPKNWMHLIAEKNPRDLQELATLMPHAAWRLENYGTEILAVLTKRASRRIED